MSCPLCDAMEAAEHLRDRWRFCPSCHMAYRVNDEGLVIEWAPTRPHPRMVRDGTGWHEPVD